MAEKQSPAMNLYVTQSEESTHWIFLSTGDVAGVVVFVIADSNIGARGEVVVTSTWSRSVRAMVVKKRESVAEAILCMSSGARGFEFGIPGYQVRAGPFVR